MYPFELSLSVRDDSSVCCANVGAEILYLQCQSAAAVFGTVPVKSCLVTTSVPVDANSIFCAVYPGQLAASAGTKNYLKNLLAISGVVPPEAQNALFIPVQSVSQPSVFPTKVPPFAADVQHCPPRLKFGASVV